MPRVPGSYEALLADPDVDVIYSPLPNTMHADWTIKAATRKPSVRKPVVTTLDETDQVEAAAISTTSPFSEAFMYLHHPQMRRLQELIAAGVLGEGADGQRLVHFYLPPERSSNIRLNRERAAARSQDVGVYPNKRSCCGDRRQGAGGHRRGPAHGRKRRGRAHACATPVCHGRGG
ncbi:MAG: Gfo/Idh/MocA family oxidoreductase [Caldilineaceae bacterium]